MPSYVGPSFQEFCVHLLSHHKSTEITAPITLSGSYIGPRNLHSVLTLIQEALRQATFSDMLFIIILGLSLHKLLE